MKIQWLGQEQQISLRNGHLYRWRINVPQDCSLINPVIPNVISAMEDKGFGEAMVFLSDRAVPPFPADWPENKKAPGAPGTGCTVYAQGRWNGPTGEVVGLADFGSAPGFSLVDVWDQTTKKALVGEPPTGADPGGGVDPPPPPGGEPPPPPPGDEPPPVTPKTPAKKKASGAGVWIALTLLGAGIFVATVAGAPGGGIGR